MKLGAPNIAAVAVYAWLVSTLIVIAVVVIGLRRWCRQIGVGRGMLR